MRDPVRLAECGNTYVVLPQAGSPEILAYFTLLPDLQDIAEFTAILLNLFAVDQRYQRQGIGQWILTQIIRDMVQAAESQPLDYLLVEPLDERARDYYLHLGIGFVSLEDGKLVLAVETMRQAIRASGANL